LGNRQSAVEVSLGRDPVADVVRKLAPWVGTATELFDVLTNKVADTITKSKDWFSRPKQVSDVLRRLAPGLRRVGIEVTFLKQGRNRTRLIEIRPIPASAASAGPNSDIDLADAEADTGPDSFAGASAHHSNVYRGENATDVADAPKQLLSGELNDDGVF